MINRENVILGIENCLQTDSITECSRTNCPFINCRESCLEWLLRSTLTLLKEQKGYVFVPFSWLVKFCTHIDFVEPLTDAEREVAWRQKLRQQFGINVSKKAVKKND